MKKKNFFLEHKQFTLFFILALMSVGVAVFAPWIAPKDPLDAVMTDSLKAPFQITHWGQTSWDETCYPV